MLKKKRSITKLIQSGMCLERSKYEQRDASTC